jgi:hypothetical protein
MRFRNSQLVMGKVAEREYQRVIVLEESVRSLCRAVSPRG